ncbi:hypothetical protein PAYE108092_21050 [Paracoccus yeei]
MLPPSVMASTRITLAHCDAVRWGHPRHQRWFNQGAAGALFDATVSGAPLTRIGNTLQLSGSTGTPTLATRASIMGIRLMWVMDCAGLTANMRLFGSDVAGTDDYELRMIVAFNHIYAWTNNGGTSSGQNIHSGNYTYPTSGLHLFEIELSPAGWAVYLDGALIGSAAILAAPFQTDFLLDRIGQGATTAVPLVADMGDILGVRLGAGAEDTIAEARTFLRRRFPGLPQ